MTYNQLKKDDINIELKQRKLEMIGDYTNTKTPTEFICHICNKHFIAKYEHVKKLKHDGCPKCSKLFAMNQKHKSTYKFRLAKMQDTKSDSLNILDYNLELNEAKCLCLLCNQEFVTSYESICMGSMHKRCASKISNKNKRLSVQEIEIRIKQRGYNLKLQESENDDNYLTALCEQYFTTTPHDLSKKWNCPNCTTNSALESKTKQFILDKGLVFETHKRFKGLQGINGGLLSYDFYLPQIKTLIECQGIQHVKPIELFGGETQFGIQKEHDKRKREYALNNGYTFVEIFYYDINNIHNILNKIVKTGGE